MSIRFQKLLWYTATSSVIETPIIKVVESKRKPQPQGIVIMPYQRDCLKGVFTKIR